MVALLLKRLLPLAAIAALLGGCSGLFLWPDRVMVRDPSAATLAFEDVTFASADDTRLHGWYLRAASQPERGTILFVHGNGGNISTHLGFVHWLPPAGYNVFIWDYRGYGTSDGEEDLAGAHADAEAALHWLVARGGTDVERLVVYGQSLGASVAIHTVTHAPDGARVRAVISESAFSGYRAIAREKLATSWLTWPLQYPLSWTLVDRYSASRSLAGIAPRPLLLVHGAADEIVPAHHALDLFALAREPKELWMIAGAGHTDCFAKKADRQRLLSWLARALPPAR